MLFEETEVPKQAHPIRFEVEPNIHLLHRLDKTVAAKKNLFDCAALSQIPLISKEVLASHDRLHFVLRSLSKVTADMANDKIKGLPKRQYSIHTVSQVMSSLFQRIPMNNQASHFEVSYGGFLKLLLEDYRPLFAFFCKLHHEYIRSYVDKTLKTLGCYRQPDLASDGQEADDTIEILAGFLKGKTQSKYERSKTFLTIDQIEPLVGSIDFRNYGNLDEVLASCESNISLVSSLILSHQTHESLPLAPAELFVLTCILCRLRNLLTTCKQTSEFEIALAVNKSEEKRKADATAYIAKSIQSLEQSAGEKYQEKVTPELVGELLDCLSAMSSGQNFSDFRIPLILEVIKQVTPTAAHKRALLAGLLPFAKLGDYDKEIALFAKAEVFSQLITKLDQSSSAKQEYEDKPFVEFLLATPKAGADYSLSSFLTEKIRKMTVTVEDCRWEPFEQYLDRFIAHSGSRFGVEEALDVLAKTHRLWVWTGFSLKFADQLSRIDFATLKQKLNLRIHPSKLSSRVHVVKKVNEEVIRTTHAASIRMPKTEKRLDFLDVIISKLLSCYPKRLASIEAYYACFQQSLAAHTASPGFNPRESDSFRTRSIFQAIFFKGLNSILLPELAVVKPDEYKMLLSEVQQACRVYDIEFETSFTGSTIKKSSQISALADEGIARAFAGMTSAASYLSLLEAMSLTEQPPQIQTLTKDILEKLVALQKLRASAALPNAN